MSTSVKEMTNVEQLQPNPMMILSAAVERGVDADQLSKLMDLQERYQANQARIAFHSAMAEFQAICPTIKKTSRGHNSNYAGYDEIHRTIRPHLEKCGLSVRFDSESSDSIHTAICYVSHRDGHTEANHFACPVDGDMRANDSQKMGSANSYAKRYALTNALNLVGSENDDDGQSAGTPTITDKQIVELTDHMEALSVDKKAFFKYLKIDKLENLPAAKWPEAMNAIERKRKQA